MKRFIAKLTAFMLILNLVVCAPVSAYAEEGESFEADSVTLNADAGTVTVTESAEAVLPPESSEAPEGTQAPIPTQSVSLEFDAEQALTEEPAGEVQVSADGAAIEYETADGAKIEESFDLSVEINEAETDSEGNLTDITYDVSLDRQTENGTDTTVTENVDEVWAAEGGEEIKVELSVNGMDADPTRVEHTYEENGESKTEYYYNEANRTEGETGKKYFTVETVKDAAETVVNKVVSLWTSFLGIFKVTNDAFENQNDMSTSSTLDEAVNNAADGSTVEMLRDYSTADSAILANGEGKGDNITVDLNGHTYEKTAGGVAVQVNGDGQSIGIQNGTVNGSRDGIYVWGSDDELTLDNVDVKSSNIGVYSAGENNKININESSVEGAYPIYIGNASKQELNVSDSEISSSQIGIYNTSTNSEVTITGSTIDSSGWGVDNYTSGCSTTIEGSTINAGEIGVFDQGKSNCYIIKGCTVNYDYSFGVYHNGSDGGATFEIIGSYIKPVDEGGVGIYISGSTATANREGEGLNSLTLKDTEVVGDTAVEVKFTDVSIDGGRLSGVGVPPDYEENSNGSTTIGTALAVTDNSNGKTGGTILISGGCFMGAKDFDIIFQSVKETTGDDKASVTIAGGHYTHPDGLYNFIAENHAAICYEDGSEYPYEVVPAGFVPSRAGYNFAGYKDADGNPITLAEAYADKKVAYINWIPAVDEPVITEGNKQQDVIVVEPDANDSSVQIEVVGSTANVTVNAPDGETSEISEVTVTSVQTLRDSGIDTISISVDKDVTFEMDITENADNGMGDRVVVRRDESTLTITDEENVQLSFELDGLKAEAESSVHINYSEGVVTIYFDSTEVFKVEVTETVKANKEITFRLENGVLKLFDKSGKLIQEIEM